MIEQLTGLNLTDSEINKIHELPQMIASLKAEYDKPDVIQDRSIIEKLETAIIEKVKPLKEDLDEQDNRFIAQCKFHQSEVIKQDSFIHSQIKPKVLAAIAALEKLDSFEVSQVHKVAVTAQSKYDLFDLKRLKSILLQHKLYLEGL